MEHLPQGFATEQTSQAESDLCVHLDAALAAATALGWPKWRTPGTGGAYPKTPVHDFSQGGLKFGARIDFFRGTPADDLMNKGW